MQDLGVAEDAFDRLDSVQGFYNRFEGQHGPLPAEIRPLMAYAYDAVSVAVCDRERWSRERRRKHKRGAKLPSRCGAVHAGIHRLNGVDRL